MRPFERETLSLTAFDRFDKFGRAASNGEVLAFSTNGESQIKI